MDVGGGRWGKKLWEVVNSNPVSWVPLKVCRMVEQIRGKKSYTKAVAKAVGGATVQIGRICET